MKFCFGAGKIAETIILDSLQTGTIEGSEFGGFLVDQEFYSRGSKLKGFEIHDYQSVANSQERHQCFVAVGYFGLNRNRFKLLEKVKRSFDIFSLVNFEISCSEPMPENVFVMSSAIVHPAVQLSEGVFVFGGANVCHHVKLGSHVWVTAGSTILGGASIGDFSFIGGGATVLPQSEVGHSSFLGAKTLVGSCEARSVFVERTSERLDLDAVDFEAMLGGY